MAKNETYKVGAYLSAPVSKFKTDTGAAVRSGQPLRIGKLNAVATTDDGEYSLPRVYDVTTKAPNITMSGPTNGNEPGFASVALVGAFKLKVTRTGAVSFGDAIYIKSDYTLTTTDSGNTLFGHAVSNHAASTTDKIDVRIAN